eukprot:365558-Chlamydomonas_euryale.AAC.21
MPGLATQLSLTECDRWGWLIAAPSEPAATSMRQATKQRAQQEEEESTSSGGGAGGSSSATPDAGIPAASPSPLALLSSTTRYSNGRTDASRGRALPSPSAAAPPPGPCAAAERGGGRNVAARPSRTVSSRQNPTLGATRLSHAGSGDARTKSRSARA